MKPPFILVAGIAAALISVAALSYLLTRDIVSEAPPNLASLTVPQAHTSTAITALTLPDTTGTNQSMSQWRGKILVVNFWATWCPPCREEMPAFSRLAEKHAANGVQFVGISIDTLNNVLDFQKRTPVSYPLLIGTMETVQNTIPLGNNAQALPFTAIFDRSGVLHSVKLGRLAEAELAHTLLALETNAETK
ncbi:MAG: TlpA family protein disulfide reductase [Rhodocyclaceae bacterium]|nr:TlpA family protein disulfide reductase [Rhodocyclaceae bacterium]MBL0074923.1 TlpA family protein disulfide reductase [Rhodocyclaceae bacterium]